MLKEVVATSSSFNLSVRQEFGKLFKLLNPYKDPNRVKLSTIFLNRVSKLEETILLKRTSDDATFL